MILGSFNLDYISGVQSDIYYIRCTIDMTSEETTVCLVGVEMAEQTTLQQLEYVVYAVGQQFTIESVC